MAQSERRSYLRSFAQSLMCQWQSWLWWPKPASSSKASRGCLFLQQQEGNLFVLGLFSPSTLRCWLCQTLWTISGTMNLTSLESILPSTDLWLREWFEALMLCLLAETDFPCTCIKLIQPRRKVCTIGNENYASRKWVALAELASPKFLCYSCHHYTG